MTGADGFLGWHLRCRAFAQSIDAVAIRRQTLADPALLADVLAGLDSVVHCAGVSRGDDGEVTDGNLGPAQLLAEGVARTAHPVRIVYANSVHSRNDTVYGQAKRKAAEVLAGSAPTPELSDVLLPNLFGEHGRAHHNSFIATFCHEVAAGRRPGTVRDADIPLLHAQDAARLLIAEAARTGYRIVVPDAPARSVTDVLELIETFADRYRHGELPDLTDPFHAQLFNTYRSHLFPAGCPLYATPRTDARGTLVECVRAGSGGQSFVSTTAAGAVRGDHVHLRKFERFMVLSGEAEVCMRRLGSRQVMRFRLTGEQPGIVDIPTLWTHNLIGRSQQPTVAFFWTNEILHPEDTDTFPIAVEPTPTRSDA